MSAFAMALAFAAGATSLARAQDGSGSPAPQAPAIPDLVRTTDGGMYRGTIVELVPGDHVTLLLASGETRRFEASQVQSAGPANTAAAPAPATAPMPTTAADDPRLLLAQPQPGQRPASGPDQVRIRITSLAPGMTLSYQSGIGAGTVGNNTAVIMQFERLCLAPCEAVIPRGNHHFVVEDANGRQRPAPNVVMVDRDGDIEISMESRRPQRVRRWLIGIGLMALSAPLFVGATSNQICEDGSYSCHPNWAYMGPAIAMIAGGYGTTMSAIFAFDRGHVEFRPY